MDPTVAEIFSDMKYIELVKYARANGIEFQGKVKVFFI